MSKPIEDYGFVGNMLSGALVADLGKTPRAGDAPWTEADVPQRRKP